MGKAAYSYSGYVGHICPFTHQLMAAGVDTHRSTNVPVQASIKLELTTGTVKVEAKQLASVTPQMTAVDIMHLHVKPFTTLKPNLLVDLIPIALSPATKVIKSQSPRKAFEMALGERLGLDLKIKAVTECEVSDKKTVLDSLRNYRYNPILAVIFQGSETALKMNGQPSVRFHRYTVVHNPAASTTKAIEMEIKLAAATKIRNTPLIKHIASMGHRSCQLSCKLRGLASGECVWNMTTAAYNCECAQERRGIRCNLGGPNTCDYSCRAIGHTGGTCSENYDCECSGTNNRWGNIISQITNRL